MVQIKLDSALIGKFAKTWGPSLSDCLEIHASLETGVANKGTWKTVSTICLLYFKVLFRCKVLSLELIDFFQRTRPYMRDKSQCLHSTG